MKNLLKYAFAVVAVAGVVLSNSSCGKDDSKEEAGKEENKYIVEDIFYVSEQTTSSITCQWDKIDYDSCVLRLQEIESVNFDYGLYRGSEVGVYPVNDAISYNIRGFANIVTISDVDSYTFGGLSEETKFYIDYNFYKRGYLIKGGTYNAMTIDGEKYESTGSFDIGEAIKIDGKKWVFFSVDLMYSCNREKVLIQSDSVVIKDDIAVSYRLIDEIHPFKRGFRVATDEDWKQLERSVGMSESDIEKFGEGRGEDINVVSLLDKKYDYLFRYVYVSLDDNGTIIKRRIHSPFTSISRYYDRKSSSAQLVFVEE